MASQEANLCVSLHSSSLRRTIRTPHSLEFVRLGLGLFAKPSNWPISVFNRKTGASESTPAFAMVWKERYAP
jgi:hypothetical protein